MRRTWMALGAVPVVIAVPFAWRTLHAASPNDAPIAKLTGAPAAAAAVAPPPPTLAGIDLTKIALPETGPATAPLPDKHVARLTLDPGLQRTAEGILKMHHIPEAAVVLMDVESGKILVYASHVEHGPPRDLVVEATAPAASVFKIVTGSSLVENAGKKADDPECYSGGEQRIVAQDLTPDPKRDKWCTTLGGAMGRSLNTVFARLALRDLKPATLEDMAKNLGFGAPLPFDVPVQPSAVKFPEDPLGYARTAAGFWNTTLSPLHAAWLSATMARGGEPVRPVLVGSVADEDGKALWTANAELAQKRAVKPETAQAVTAMMETTTSDGTSYRAFHDGKGQAFLPGIAVAGKTGTLTDGSAQRFYTWFTGFAPSRPYVVENGKNVAPRKVAVSVLVVNQPTWTVKANVVAREVLRAYFASENVPSVSTPQLVDRSTSPRAGQPSTTPATKQRRQRGS